MDTKQFDIEQFIRRFFITHRGLDEVLALNIESWLQEMGLQTIIDKFDFLPGQDFTVRMEEVESVSHHTICVMTEHFFESQYCRDEFNAAFENSKSDSSHLLIIMAGHMKDEDLPECVSKRIFIDLRGFNEKQQKERFQKEIKALMLKTRRTIPELEHDVLVFFAKFRQLEQTKRQPGELWPYVLKNEMIELIKHEDVQLLELTSEIESEEQAKKLLKSSGAKLVVWGAIADGMIEVHYTPESHSFVPVESYFRPGKHSQEIVKDMQAFQIYLDSGGDTEYVLSMLLAFLNAKKGNWEKTHRLLTRSINLVHDGSRQEELFLSAAYDLRGIANHILGHFQDDLNDTIKSVELHPDSPPALNNRAGAYFTLGMFDEALNDVNQAIRLNPFYADAYFNRGDLFARLERYDEAMKDYATGIERSPNAETTASGYYHRARLYQILNNDAKALTDYNKVIGLKPMPDRAYYAHCGRGGVYESFKKRKHAYEDFSAAINLYPMRAFAYALRGGLFILSSKYQEAQEDLDKSLQLDPNLGIAHTFLGLLHLHMRPCKRDSAFAEFNKAIELDPTQPNSYYWRGYLHDERAHYRQALFDFEHYIAMVYHPDLNVLIKIKELKKRVLRLGIEGWYLHGKLTISFDDLPTALRELELYVYHTQSTEPEILTLISDLKALV